MEGHAVVARPRPDTAEGSLRTVAYLAASELRRRWAGWLVVAIGIALVSAIVLGSLAGARRTAGVDERARLDNRVATTAVGIDELNEAEIDRIRQLDPIEASAIQRKYVGALDGFEDHQFVIDAGEPALGRDIDRLTYVEGRPAEAADEIVLDSLTAATVGAGAGDTVEIELWDPAAIDYRARTATSRIPLTVRVVGVANSPRELTRLPGYLNAWASPAFDDAHRQFANFAALSVRLAGGESALADLNSALHELSGEIPALDGDIGAVTESGDPESRVGSALDAIALVLVAIGGAVLVTGSVAFGTIVIRRFSRSADDLRSFEGMGASRRQRVWSLAVVPIAMGVPAVVVGAVIAWLGSDLFPYGIADRLETRPGRVLDLVVLGPAGAFLVVLLVALAWSAAATVARRARRTDRVAPRMRHLPLPVGGPLATGVGFALLPSRGRVSVRTALAGVVVGVTGVVAVLTFSSSVQAIESTPERFGWDFDIAANGVPDETTLQQVEGLDEVESTAVLSGDLVRLPDGVTWTMQIDPRPVDGRPTDETWFTVLDGRTPVTSGEIAAGPLWLRSRGLEIGDVIPAANGGDAVSVVGSVLVPALDEDAVGGTVVVADRHDLSAQVPVTSTLIRLAPGADRDQALERIRDVLPAGSITPRSTALVPTEVSNVGRTLGLQRLLSVFLGLIAVVALAHALASTVRDRARDLFILRAVGFTPRQAGMTIGWMSVTNTVVGLIIGIPCGILLGSVVWRAVSEAVGIGPDATVPWQAATIVAVSGLVLTVAVAVVPAWRAAHVRRDALD